MKCVNCKSVIVKSPPLAEGMKNTWRDSRGAMYCGLTATEHEPEPTEAAPVEPDEDYRMGKPHPPVSHVLEREAVVGGQPDDWTGGYIPTPEEMSDPNFCSACCHVHTHGQIECFCYCDKVSCKRCGPRIANRVVAETPRPEMGKATTEEIDLVDKLTALFSTADKVKILRKYRASASGTESAPLKADHYATCPTQNCDCSDCRESCDGKPCMIAQTHIESAHLQRAQKAEAELAALKSQPSSLTPDDPELDATDLAHPAWWRGQDHVVKVLCQKINEILDGKDDGRGVSSEPWESTRRRLITLASSLTQAGPDVCRWCAKKILKCDHSKSPDGGGKCKGFMHTKGNLHFCSALHIEVAEPVLADTEETCPLCDGDDPECRCCGVPRAAQSQKGGGE